MSLYFEKARELGQLILASEESLRLSDARAAVATDADGATEAELIRAERTYAALVQQVLGMVRATATGDLDGANSCGTGCGGCCKK